jgi:protein TonB
MERPSHIIFSTQSRYFSHRLPLIGLALSFQAAAVWLFMHAFVPQGFHLPPGPITFTPFDDPPQPRVKPPEPTLKPLPIPKPADPLSGVTFDPPERGTITVSPVQEPRPAEANPTGITRAPVSITATHTAPPYPPVARRIGVEGKVTLRLTVTAEGRVAQADIVTSSGRDDLDQTAQAWIVAHWTYKPALANGTPAVGHTLATVVFSLINEH